MTHKTVADIVRIIGKGKPAAVVARFVQSWQLGEAYKQDYQSRCPDDVALTGYAAWLSALDESYTPPDPDLTEGMAEIEVAVRARRDVMLWECDWTQCADVALSAETVLGWQEYRQALRDVPDQTDFPLAVEWPEKP